MHGCRGSKQFRRVQWTRHSTLASRPAGTRACAQGGIDISALTGAHRCGPSRVMATAPERGRGCGRRNATARHSAQVLRAGER